MKEYTFDTAWTCSSYLLTLADVRERADARLQRWRSLGCRGHAAAISYNDTSNTNHFRARALYTTYESPTRCPIVT